MCKDHPSVSRMYKGFYVFQLDKENCAKLEEMLRYNWKAVDISLREISPGLLHLSFKVDDNRKVHIIGKVIKYYGGEVKEKWIRLIVK